MTGFTTYDEYATAVSQSMRLPIVKAGGLSQNVGFGSMWINTPDPGAIPSTAVATTNATAGAFNNVANVLSASQSNWLTNSHYSLGNASSTFSSFILLDRLSHQGGLDGTVTSAQTTNLPTAALTRYTSGVGVFIALEIYTAVGNTGTTAVASYTNQAGTAGRTTKEIVFGGSGFQNAGRFLMFPLQDGDTGARSVESVTLTASTTTAGNFGVTLFRMLNMMPIDTSASQPYYSKIFNGVSGAFQFEDISGAACLNSLQVGASTLTTQMSASFMFKRV